MRNFTNSLLHSQKVASKARSSSGVKRSDEKMVCVVSIAIASSGAFFRRLTALVFIAVFPLLKEVKEPRSGCVQDAFPCPEEKRRTARATGHLSGKATASLGVVTFRTFAFFQFVHRT